MPQGWGFEGRFVACSAAVWPLWDGYGAHLFSVSTSRCTRLTECERN